MENVMSPYPPTICPWQKFAWKDDRTPVFPTFLLQIGDSQEISV